MTQAWPVALPAELRALLLNLSSADVADDQAWILALMHRHGLPVITMLWRMLGREADVLDAYQTAVCKLTARGRGGIDRNRAGYFYRTAMNAGIEILRGRQRQRQHWTEVADVARRRPEERTGVERLGRSEAGERLRAAICQLPPQLRSVIILRDLAETPYTKVAGVLGIQVNTARLYRRQAVIRLAELMGEDES